VWWRTEVQAATASRDNVVFFVVAKVVGVVEVGGK